jgi:hypothetical protein
MESIECKFYIHLLTYINIHIYILLLTFIKMLYTFYMNLTLIIQSSGDANKILISQITFTAQYLVLDSMHIRSQLHDSGSHVTTSKPFQEPLDT